MSKTWLLVSNLGVLFDSNLSFPESSPYPDQMLDLHLVMTTTALNISEDHDDWTSRRDRSPVKTDKSSAQTLWPALTPSISQHDIPDLHAEGPG